MPWPLDNPLAEPAPDTSGVPPRKDMGTWGIYSVIDPEDETFAQGLQEDEWIIANVDWLTDMFSRWVLRWRRPATAILPGRESSRLALHQLRWVYVN